MNISIGTLCFHLSCKFNDVKDAIELIYGNQPTCSFDFVDFKTKIVPSSILRHVVKANAHFSCGNVTPFYPLPRAQAYPLFEWGMNWCIAAYEYNDLLIHSAVLVKNDKAILFPALPGAGKSTLSALLSGQGWTVYSDEMAMIDLKSHKVQPFYRPVCLKNESIDLVKQSLHKPIITQTFPDTTKGDVAHLKTHTWEAFQQLSPAKIVGVVFPQYISGQDLHVDHLSTAKGFTEIIKQSFNYHVIGKPAFTSLVRLLDEVPCVTIAYENVGDVAQYLEQCFSL